MTEPIHKSGFVAHTPNIAGKWHPLREHIEDVSRTAEAFASVFGAGELARIAGMLHDLGKYSDAFQAYLWDCHLADLGLSTCPKPGSAPHKQAGAAHIAPANLPLAVAILGHHGKIPDLADSKQICVTFDTASLSQLRERAAADGLSLPDGAGANALMQRLASDAVGVEMLTRMVYSCLVDADSLDTEEHRDPSAGALRAPRADLKSMAVILRRSQEALMAAADPTPVNVLRKEVYESCVAAAAGVPGVYRLTVPTGGGKTRSSLAFALEHAVRHGMGRVIYAIPYTSIIDQTVQVFEGIFGPDAVLEHHSAIEPLEPENAEAAELQHEVWRRLAAQNWDAPLVVTTTVQLFESLFGNRPARCRKVHRLANAVIVLDEVQTLPPLILKPLVDGLRLLAQRYGTTVLLCTATQPSLDNRVLEKVGFENVPEIAPDPARFFRELERVTFRLEPLSEAGWSWNQVAAAMLEALSSLCILNTRKDALAVVRALRVAGCSEVLHLSTLLCGAHRRDVLAEIKRRLAQGERCMAVATQVVECGCDLDFPRVLRALGPLDRIVQAAGRCNREGLRPASESEVIVFRPAEGGAPHGPYRTSMNAAEAFINAGANLHDPQVYERYFGRVYGSIDTDARRIQQARAGFDFPRVADELKLIDEDTVGVVVPYAGAAAQRESLLQELAARGRMTRDLWRKAQPLIVSLRRKDWERFRKRGLIVEAHPGVDLWLWNSSYDPVCGLTEDAGDPADLIV